MVRSPRKKQPAGKALSRHILSQLSAALENPDIKALELYLRKVSRIISSQRFVQWAEDGRGVVVHAERYEEELQNNKELFPELKDLTPASALQVWLLASGFQLREAKVDSQVLVFQHTDFQKVHPKAQGTEALGGNSSFCAAHQKKRKRRRPRSSRCCGAGSSGGAALDALGRLQRLRPLYQYINLESPELSGPDDEEEEEEGEAARQAQAERGAGAPRRATAPELQGGAGDPAGPEDRAAQVDVEKMLSVCAAHLVPPLSPQHK